MRIKAEDLARMLRKMDEVEEKAAQAYNSSRDEDLAMAVEKMRELRAMLYEVLEREEEAQAAPYPVAYPIVAPMPWWEQISCKSGTEAE